MHGIKTDSAASGRAAESDSLSGYCCFIILLCVTDEDEGTYTCTSENSVGKTEASAMLQVHGRKQIMHIVYKRAHTHGNNVAQKAGVIPALCVFISVRLCESPSCDAARSLY